MQQKSVRAVDLHHVEAGAVCACPRVAPGFHDGRNLPFAERARHGRAPVLRDGARCHQLPRLPIVNALGFGGGTGERVSGAGAATLDRSKIIA